MDIIKNMSLPSIEYCQLATSWCYTFWAEKMKQAVKMQPQLNILPWSKLNLVKLNFCRENLQCLPSPYMHIKLSKLPVCTYLAGMLDSWTPFPGKNFELPAERLCPLVFLAAGALGPLFMRFAKLEPLRPVREPSSKKLKIFTVIIIP